jgi:hypothetical protein
MNELVLEMNKALRSAVERAGPNVHFIDYDDIVQSTYGTFCQPGQDESAGKGANRHELFFYQMKSRDTPMLEDPFPYVPHGLRRRQDDADDTRPTNGTLQEYYGALIEQAIKASIDDGDDEYAALYDDNANDDLQEEVDDELKDQLEEADKITPATAAPALGSPRFLRRSTGAWNFTFAAQSSGMPSPNRNIHLLGSKVSANYGANASSFSAQSTNMRLPNSTTFSISPASAGGDIGEDTAIGTVVANKTHIILQGGKPVQRTTINIKKLFVSDLTFRVFHPTQAGHAAIANLVLFQMAQDNAKRLGT